MKIILTKDVKGIGHMHDAVDAADGYALNYLIPRNLAVAATPSARTEAEARRKQARARKELDEKLLAQNIAALAEARLVVRARANEKGHLYDAVGEPEIRKAAAESRIDLPEGALKLEKPLKELGTFAIPVSAGEAFGTVSVTVEAAG